MLPLARLLLAAVIVFAAPDGAGPKAGGQAVPPPPPDANPGTVPPPPPDANPGTTPAPATPSKENISLKEMVNQASLRQNDPAAFQAWMTKIAPAYNRVFGDGAFARLTDFQKTCQEKCQPDQYMNTANFFQDAARLASLEDDARAGSPPPDSIEYKRRDAAIKDDLKTTVSSVQPQRDDAPEVITGFDKAYEPVKRVVMTPEEHQDSAQQAARQTDSAPSYSNLGNVLLQNGNASAAQGAFNQSINRDPSNADAYSGRAQADYNLGDYPAAAKDAASALDLNPQDEAARNTLLLSERRLPQGSWP